MSRRIPASRIVDVRKPALIATEAADDSRGDRSLTVIPLVEGEHVAGFEIRCGCGTRAVVDCIYEAPATVGQTGLESGS